ncbi:MAG TPA: YciI family protein [Polyangiaceae bacterium]|nr:YciI family protein [Polyangiaceae bacterium]
MKFLLTYTASENAPPTPEKMAAIGKFAQEMSAAGILLMTGGLERPTKGTHVKLTGDAFSVTDGPFAETKEVIDGFALVRAASRQEALALAERFMRIAGDGVGEILQVFDAADMP